MAVQTDLMVGGNAAVLLGGAMGEKQLNGRKRELGMTA